jgi:ABC-type maltose transport system permease subunit
MIEIILIVIAFAFMFLRLINSNEISTYYIVFELLAGVFMTLAMFLLVFPVPTIQLTNTLIYSAGGALQQYIITNSTANNAPALSSGEPMIIYLAVAAWDLLVVVLLLLDVPPLWFPKKLPKTPTMEISSQNRKLG